MDRVTTYTFAYGNPKQILDGNLEVMPNAPSVRELDLIKIPKTIIYEPKYVGVYQGTDIVEHNSSEKSLADLIRERKTFQERFSREIQKEILGETTNPKLIAVGYNPENGENRDTVLMAFGGKGLDGKLIAPYTKFPDFYQKDILVSKPFFQEEMSEEELGEMAKSLEKQRRTFGLTGYEHALLQLIN